MLFRSVLFVRVSVRPLEELGVVRPGGVVGPGGVHAGICNPEAVGAGGVGGAFADDESVCTDRALFIA